jgi:hypothetical protein
MKLSALALALAATLGGIVGAHGQAYPSRPVTIIVPFPAGGPNDTLARILAERMRPALGQTIIVENVTGAGASIGVVTALLLLINTRNNVALEDGATGWLKFVSGQDTGLFSIHQDAFDVHCFDHREKTLGCFEVRIFTRDALDRSSEAGELQRVREKSLPSFLLSETVEIGVNRISGRHDTAPLE